MTDWLEQVPMPTPLYTAENCRPAYQLNWSVSLFWRAPAPGVAGWLERLQRATESDGVRILEHRLKSPVTSQFLVSTRPETAPPQIIRSLKGRLQYLLRDDVPKAFHRNYSIYSVGSVRRDDVEVYVQSQLDHHVMADARLQERLSRYQIVRPEIDLSAVQRSSHGEYSYNLHLVLVHAERWNEIDDEVLTTVHGMVLRVSRSKRHRLSRTGILTDHVHLVLGCEFITSPLGIALGYLNNLAYAQGMRRVYQYGFYVGTVGEYDLGVVRRNLGA